MTSAERLKRLALRQLDLRLAKCRNGHPVEAWEKDCPKCRAIRQAAWRQRHPVKYKAAQKKYYYESTGRLVRAAYQEAVQRAIRELEREEETVESGYVS